MKGIILAGGLGSRLFPITKGLSKQLLPVYDKPMVYYPLSVLLQSGIKEILLISTPHDIDLYKRLLGNGFQWGINIKYKIQPQPKGLAEAFILGEEFIGKEPVCLILGDNIFYGLKFKKQLEIIVNRTKSDKKATIFGYSVKNPQLFGVIEFDNNNNALYIEEKPKNPKSNIAVIGLYFYPNSVIDVAKSIKPSKRGELEITDINNFFLKEKMIHVESLESEFKWLDTGTFNSLIEASKFIKSIEKIKGFKVGCLEEIAFKKGYISKDELLKQAENLKTSSYGVYLINKFIKH
tara:strand:+ start:246 stop:1124 length:879 start_codon:yes stop_codon:yes gene_type:complete